MKAKEIPDNEVQGIIDRFHVLWYERYQRQTWRATTWMGHPVQQCPMDLWVYQELIHRTRPEAIIEVGIKRGGLTHYLSSLLDIALGEGEGIVVGIDLSIEDARKAVSGQKRVKLVEGSSIDEGVVDAVREHVDGRRAMAILDSDHSAPHVLRELELYSDLVAPGCYLIVNDSNVNGHPAFDAMGPGPFEAIQQFLAKTDDFEVDHECEKHLMTLNPSGYLRRTGP